MRITGDELLPGLIATETWKQRSTVDILQSLSKLRAMHTTGLLGGDVMPEDANPGLSRDSADNYHYFTLPMALNYQRNSYSLWKSAVASYAKEEERTVFRPIEVASLPESVLRDLLTRSRIALQPQRHVRTWRTICISICELFDGDIRNLFQRAGNDARKILEDIQKAHKRRFPCLCGPKICNYWLYVMGRYTDVNLSNREAISVAPDTHVIQASIRLGLIDPAHRERHDIQDLVNKKWREALTDTGMLPIDIHTPLWLWSRSGFSASV